MSFSKNIKNLTAALFSFYVINNFTLPIGYAFRDIPSEVQNNRIQEVMGTKNYVYDYPGNGGETALDFLKLAHAITSKNIRYCSEQWPTANENLENGVGDCYQIAEFTYSNFLYLIDQNDKPELTKYVRLAFGEVSSSEDGGGHCWLEFLSDSEWKEYETTEIDLPRGVNIDPKLVDYLISDTTVLDIERLDYNRTISFQRQENGEFDTRNDLEGMLKSKGLVYHIYSSIKHSV